MSYKKKIRILKGLFLINLLFSHSFLLYSTSEIYPACKSLDNNTVILETAAVMDALKIVVPSITMSSEFTHLRNYIEDICISASAPEIAESIMLCRTYFEENKELIKNTEEREAVEHLLTKLEDSILRQPIFRSNPQNIRLDFNTGVIGIDTTNSRFGVNTQSPQASCHVQGGLLVADTSHLQGTLTLDGDIIPNSNTQSVGSSTNYWENIYTTSIFGHDETLTGTLVVQGNFTVNGTFIAANTQTSTHQSSIIIKAFPSDSGCVIFEDSIGTTTIARICAPDLLSTNYTNLHQVLRISAKSINNVETLSTSIDTSGNVTIHENLTVDGAFAITNTSAFNNNFNVTDNTTITGATILDGVLTQSGGNVIFDGNNYTLFIDETNHVVGVLLSTPTYVLDVNGTISTNALITTDATISGTLIQSGGNVSFDSTLFIDEINHRIGVINNTPAYALDVTGTINTGGLITAGATINGPLTQSGGNVAFDGNNYTLFIDETNHRVGILDNAPAYALDITGTINTSGLIIVHDGATINGALTQAGGAVTLGGNVNVTGNVLPSNNGEYTLGSPAKDWNFIYANNLNTADSVVSGNLAVSGDFSVNGTLVADNRITQTYLTACTILAPIGGSACLVFSDQTGTNTLATICVENPSNPGSSRNLTVNPYGGALRVTGTILPSLDATYDLGSVDNVWNTLFVQNVNLSSINSSNAVSITAGSDDNISIGSGVIRSTRAPCTGTPTSGVAFNLSTNGAITAYAAGQTAGTGYGCNSVDLQVGRSASTQVASGIHATIPGGYGNTASGDYSFAAGQNATAAHTNAFTWSDGTAYSSSLSKTFNVCATNGFYVQGGASGAAIISAPSSTTDPASHLTINAGSASGAYRNGGNLSLLSGGTSGQYGLTGSIILATATASTGDYIQTGSCANLGFPRPPTGGPIQVLAGNGASSSALSNCPFPGAGGPIIISAGNGGTTTTTNQSEKSSCPYGAGGAIALTTGNGGYSTGASSNEVPGNGGNCTITTGSGGSGGILNNASGAGGNITLTAGAGGSSGSVYSPGAGGNITLTAGAGTNGGASGSVNIASNFAQSAGTANIGSDATTNAINIGTGTTGGGRTITIGATGNTTTLNGSTTITNPITLTNATITGATTITGTTTMTGVTNINTSGNADTTIGLTNSAHVGIGGDAGTGTTTLLVSGTTRIVGDLNITGTITAGSGLIVTTGGATINGSVNALTSNFTITGTFTQSGGVVSLGADNTPNAINIGTGNVVRTIHIGDNSTPANSITIGGTNSTTTIVGALTLPTISSLATTGAITAGSGLTVTTGGATIGGALSAGNTTISGTLHATGNTTISGTLAVGDTTLQGRLFAPGIGSVSVLATVLTLSSGEIRYVISSRRYKDNIRPIGEYSSLIHQLNPVLFTYKNDESKRLNAGLIAEEVEKIMPEMVVYKDGKVESVRYHDFISLILNELQKSTLHLNALEQEALRVDALEKMVEDLQE